MSQELSIERLRRVCESTQLGCATSQDFLALESIIGQERAVRSLKFGLDIKEKGFNIYVAGRPGTGRVTAIKHFLEEIAKKKPVPSDWCYVNNFRDNYRPNALRLPAGRAEGFRADIEKMVTSAAREIRSSFESEEYARHKEEVVQSFQQEKAKLIEAINEQARQAGFMLQPTPMGVLTIPVRKGKPLDEEEFLALNQEERAQIEETQHKLQAALEASMRQSRSVDKKAVEAVQKLDQEVALYALKPLVEEAKEKYHDLEEIPVYIDQIQANILENLSMFRAEPDEQPRPGPTPQNPMQAMLKKYAVNVLVNNSDRSGAPVIIETNPTYNNLFGRVEQEFQFGAVVTDFTLVRGGSLHKANGGYLVLPAEELLRAPLAWESLKRALVQEQITIEEAGEKLGLISTKSLRPEPIPMQIKVVLIGRPDVFQLLFQYDEEFDELFKVKADFDTQMERSDEHMQEYAAFVCTVCEAENLKHFDSSALGKIIEYSSRLAEDQEKLSTHFGEIADVIREASFYATQEDQPYVTNTHVTKAIEERFYRSSLVQERIREMIERDIIKIDVDGEQVGQVNGLSVIGLGDITFGQPSRITVSLGLGREGLVDIEREAKLGGPIHTKGVMILSGYLLDKFAQDKPISLSARLVFEQNYSGVEGDSASSTELYAILSALSGVPIRQSIAVTGSVNQKGEVQAIGGVNEKIEGFFEVCKAKGFTGKQGVMVPESNVSNLMLKEAVLEAVKEGKFHIWSAKTIDEGIEILTGVSAGKRLPSGELEEGSVFDRVDKRLRELAEKFIKFNTPEGKEQGGKTE